MSKISVLWTWTQLHGGVRPILVPFNGMERPEAKRVTIVFLIRVGKEYQTYIYSFI